MLAKFTTRYKCDLCHFCPILVSEKPLSMEPKISPCLACASSSVPTMPVAKSCEGKRKKERKEANMSRVMQDSSCQYQSGHKRREKISNQDSDAIYPYRSVTGLFYEIDTRQFSTCWWPQKLYIAHSWDLNLAWNTPGLGLLHFVSSETVTMGVLSATPWDVSR